MENIIQKHRAFVAGQIEKSFNNEFQVPNQEVEKAYNVGDEKDFNGRTYYVHGLNAKGQPLWRLKDKKTKSDNERKFKEDFKDASDDVLQKIVEGKIQAGDQEKKWATDIINERKKSGKSEAAAKKVIDLLTASSSKYTDIKKVVAFKTDNGNWAIDYDGANTGIILNGSKLSERELRTAGVKIEGANANKKTNDTDNEFVTSKEFSKNKNAVTEILSGCDSKDDNGSTKYHVKFYALGMDRGSAWMKNSDIESYLRQYSDAKITPIKSNKTTKTDPRDKIAQDAGFKDYAEMKGFQEYVTTKSLLKKPSMQAKTKQAEREALEKQVADYEKNHADVIAARNGGKKADTGSITLKITTNGSGVVKLSDSSNVYKSYFFRFI